MIRAITNAVPSLIAELTRFLYIFPFLLLGVFFLFLSPTIHLIVMQGELKHSAYAAINLPDFRFSAVGDWGCNSNTQATVNNIVGKNSQLVLGLGDNSYQSTADCWFQTISPIDSKMKTAIGNHDDQSTALLNQYMTHFGLTKEYYSFNYQNVHFLAIATEVSDGIGSAQYNFVNNDLASASTNPNIKSIIVFVHKDAYSSPNFLSPTTSFRDTYHPLFDKYHVDLVLEGHQHNYQRSFPLTYNSNSPSNPTVTSTNTTDYIKPKGEIWNIAGTGGISLFSLDSQSPFVASQFEGFGYLVVDVTNNGTKYSATFYSNGGAIKDHYTITKTTTTKDTTPPSQVTGLTVTTPSGTTQLNLAWNANTETDLNHYNIYRGTTAGFPVNTSTDTPIARPTTNSYTDSGLTASTTYYYKVAAVDNAGNIGALSAEASGTTGAGSDTTPPSQVTGLTVTTPPSGGTSTQLNLAWKANTETDLNHYNIYRGTTAGFTVNTATDAPIANPTTNSYTDSGLTASTTYYYKVAAVDNAGNIGALSAEAAGTTAGPYHYAPYLTLTGTNYMDVPNTSSLQLTKFSVASWFQTSNVYSTVAAIVNKGGLGSETAGQNMNYGILVSSTNKLQGAFETSTGTDNFVNSPSTYSDGQWHYAVVTYDGSVLNLYVDNIKVATKSTSGAVPDNTGTQPVRIGANSLKLNSFFTGNVDEVRVWNRALTASEIASQYSSGIFDTTGQVLYLPFS